MPDKEAPLLYEPSMGPEVNSKECKQSRSLIVVEEEWLVLASGWRGYGNGCMYLEPRTGKAYVNPTAFSSPFPVIAKARLRRKINTLCASTSLPYLEK